MHNQLSAQRSASSIINHLIFVCEQIFGIDVNSSLAEGNASCPGCLHHAHLLSGCKSALDAWPDLCICLPAFIPYCLLKCAELTLLLISARMQAYFSVEYQQCMQMVSYLKLNRLSQLIGNHYNTATCILQPAITKRWLHARHLTLTCAHALS